MPSPLALATVSGLLTALAHPPFGAWPLIFLAVAPFLVVVGRRSARHDALLGLVFGMAFWAPHLFWLNHTMRVYGGLPWILSLGVWILLAAILSTLDQIPLALALGRMRRASPATMLAIAPLAFAVQELWRSWHFSGFPWGFAAQALVPVPALLSPAAWIGGYGLSALVVAIGVGVVGLLSSERRELAVGGVWLAVAAVVFGAGVLRPAFPSVGSLRVAVLQPGVPQELRWTALEVENIYFELLAATERLAQRAAPELIVWPESANPFSFDRSVRVRTDVIALAARSGSAILFNTVRDADRDRYFNSARAVGADGRISEAVDKHHLVPFGEYVPPAFGWAGKIVHEIGDFTPGSEPRPLRVPLADGRELPVGVGICYEAVYPDVFRGTARGGAEVLVSVTNDGWYGGLGAEAQHLSGAVLQAVANGRALVRGAVTGISAVVLPDGRVLQRLPLDTPGEIVAEVPRIAAITLATRLGDRPACAAAALLACVILLARPRSAAKSPP